jgi:hypothetical protein
LTDRSIELPIVQGKGRIVSTAKIKRLQGKLRTAENGVHLPPERTFPHQIDLAAAAHPG